jgi:hypothetical protein
MFHWEGVYHVAWLHGLFDLMAWMEEHNDVDYFCALTKFTEWLEGGWKAQNN